MSASFEPSVSGLFSIDHNPLRRKRFRVFGLVWYRNHEIPCPQCGEVVQTLRLSITHADFGKKFFCDWCGVHFIYRYTERG